MPVEIGVARGVGDLRGVHALDRGTHLGLDHVLGACRVEREHRGDALRHGLGRDDDDLLVRQRDALLGGHDDVLVVRQHKHDLRRGLVDLGENVLRGGVHGLAAGDDAVDAQLAEEVRHAFAGGHGHDAELLFGRGHSGLCLGRGGGVAAGEGSVLVAHVFDLHGLERAVGQRLGQHLAGHVRVHVHLDDLVIIDHDDTVAEVVEERAQQLGALVVFTRHDKLRAVAERDLSGVELGEVRALFRCGGGSRSGRGHGGGGAALQVAEHGVHDEHEALAAGVDHTCAAQHGVDVLRVGQRLARSGEQRLEHGLKVRALLGKLHGGLRTQTADGEDRALGRLHDGFVGGVHTGGDGGGKLCGVCVLAALEGLGDPAEQQRQDDAGVAARTAQQGACGAVGHGTDGVGLLAAELDGGGVHRQAHVRAGVTVRNREDVELVDALFVFFQCRIRAQEHLPKRCGINNFSQICTPPTGEMKMARKRGSREGKRCEMSLLNRGTWNPRTRPHAQRARRWPD